MCLRLETLCCPRMLVMHLLMPVMHLLMPAMHLALQVVVLDEVQLAPDRWHGSA